MFNWSPLSNSRRYSLSCISDCARCLSLRKYLFKAAHKILSWFLFFILVNCLFFNKRFAMMFDDDVYYK